MIQIKRVYNEPDKQDGVRILVDRVWPRGLSKKRANIDEWRKELAPSTALRKWFSHDPAKWKGFRERYRKELAESGAIDALKELAQRSRHERSHSCMEQPMSNRTRRWLSRNSPGEVMWRYQAWTKHEEVSTGREESVARAGHERARGNSARSAIAHPCIESYPVARPAEQGRSKRQPRRPQACHRLCRFPKSLSFLCRGFSVDKMIDQYFQKRPDNRNGEQRGEDDEFISEHVLKYSASTDFDKHQGSPS